MSLNLNYIISLEAAVVAGKAIKSIYLSKNYEIETKADDSPVTRADKTSSVIIAQYLRQTSIPVIDEENSCPDYSIRKTWNNLWLVDPMDGTREFISGNGEFTVNIALIESGRAIFGVIYSPITGYLYFGGKETGSFKLAGLFEWPGILEIETHAELLKPENNTSLKLRVAASRSHLDAKTQTFLDQLEKAYGEMDFVSKGSSLKLCMIAEGLTEVYPRFSRTMEWDTAAGHAIVSGTAGVLLQADSLKELEYNKEDLSNPSFYALSGIQWKKGLKKF